MCKHFRNNSTDVYYHQVNPIPSCRVTFSFGFYQRNNHLGLNPYGLIPIPSPNLYSGPFIPNWTFAVNLRIKCQQTHNLCNLNIVLAQRIHALWHSSTVWKTHPHYVSNAYDQGVDFIASPNIRKFYLLKGSMLNPAYKSIAIWFMKAIADYGIGIEVEEVEVLPPDAIDITQWIKDRIEDINDLPPFQDYLGINDLVTIPAS